MFKNREIRIRMAKTTDGAETAVSNNPLSKITKNDVIDVANGVAKTVAGATIAVIAAKSIAVTAQEIAIYHGTK